MDKLLERAEKHGPWLILLIYYFVFLNSQLKEIVGLLQAQTRLMQAQQQWLELLARLYHL